ncbi:MAG: hypothetical protein VKK07_12295, partial [Merismopediaceae bacterium]|nr:hypothetical protein [Merismopediaceae bacterium]
LSNVKVQQITLQDALKADATYSWLMVIGNTISANVGSDDPVYSQMFAEAKAIAKSFGKPFDDNDPVLWIDPAAALDGKTYEPLKELFFKTFSVDAVWLMWEQSGPLAENLYTMYTNLVEAGKWHRIENPAELAGKPAPQNGGRWVSYAESKQEDIKGDTNILSFMLDGQGNVLNYAQRGRMFIGTETLHLANVELWETSTVKEAVSGSTQMSAFVKALSAVIDDKKVLKALQRNLFREGAETMMRLKMLMSMEQGNRFGITHEGEQISFGSPINLKTVKGEDGKGRLVMSQNDQQMLLALLEKESGVHPSQLTSGGSLVFKDVTFALRNIVFQIDPVAASDYYGDTVDHGSYWEESEYEEPTDVTKSVTSWWLPALMSLSKLSTNSEENRDFVSIFFRNVLVPLLLGKSVESIEVNRMLGVFKSFLANKNTVKLLNGRRNTGAKRIGMPNIPYDETWVMYSEDTNSHYQQLKRDGVDVDGAKAGKLVIGVGNRPPMPVGFISYIRVITEDPKTGEQYPCWLEKDGHRKVWEKKGKKKLFYKLSPVQVGVNLMMVYFDGGDFAGGVHFWTALRELDSKCITNIQQLFAMRESALGVDFLSAQCKTYFKSHYEIKSWDKATATLLSSSLVESAKKKALKTIEEYSDYNYNAFGVQNIGVGVMYSVYMLGEILVDFALHLKAHKLALPEELKVLAGKDAESLVVVAAEIYKIMLGGYDPAAVRLRNSFLESIKAGVNVAVNEANITELEIILRAMKANASKAREVLQIMSLVAKCYAINKGIVPALKPVLDEKGQVVAGAFNSADISHWLCCALTVYELNRGNFDGFNGIGRPKAGGKRGAGHRAALSRSFQLVKQLKSHGRANASKF